MGTEKILDKIKKLIKKQVSSEEIGSTEEAEIFAAKVQELLAKHNLEMGQINLEEDKESDDVVEEFMKSMLPTIGGSSAFDILYPIAKYNWCKVYTFGGRGSNEMGIFGKAENVEICKYIFNIVSKVFIRSCKSEYADYVEAKDWYFIDRKMKPVGYDTFARAFMKGASIGLHEKLKEEREKFEKKNEKAGAIILMNDAAIDQYMEKFGEKGKMRRVRQENNGGALQKGYKTGKEVSITAGLGSTKSKPIERKLLK